MITIDYLLGTNRSVLLGFAKAFNKAFTQNVKVEDNRLIFPRSMATGRFEFYELEDGMTLMLVDAIFTKEMQFVSEVDHSGFYAIRFFVGKENVQLQLDDGTQISVGNSWMNSVFLSAPTATATVTVPQGVNFKIAVLRIHKRWLSQLLKEGDWLTDLLGKNEIVPVQHLKSMNIEMLVTIEDAFNKANRQYTSAAYLQGCVRKLLAQLYDASLNVLPENKTIGEPRFRDVLTIIQIKHDLEKDMMLAQLNIDRLASKYKMSRTKLNSLFKMTYGDYFNEIAHKVRMQGAVELLLQGHSILEIGHKVGYGNTSHFARTFYNTFKITPKKYQMAARPVKEKLNKVNMETKINY